MKKRLIYGLLAIGMVAGTSCIRENQQQKQSLKAETIAAPTDSAKISEDTTGRIEIICFYGAKRCDACVEMEKRTRHIVDSLYADDPRISFRAIDIREKENQEIAERYSAVWSALFVNTWKNGKEHRDDLTKFGLGLADKIPERFDEGMIMTINDALENLTK